MTTQTVGGAGDAGEPPGHEVTVLAPRVTRVTSLIVMAGVLIQATLAGGFLAGYRGLTTVHMIVGMVMILSAIVLVAVGLLPRRDHRRWLRYRVAVLLALVVTGIAGAMAGQGARNLLIVHIPLAIVAMGLASRLVVASGRLERPAG